jgi:hypothetical protein
MRLYHFDPRWNVEAIMRDGFHDRGVWLSHISLLDDADPPLGPDFAQEVVEEPDDELGRYEIVNNPLLRPSSHCEWCVPALIVNRWPRRLLD